MSKHTALPWTYAYGAIYNSTEKYRVALMDRETPFTSPTERDSNAKYIVKACNTHQSLVDALEEITSRFERLETLYFKTTNQTPDCENGSVKRAREALKNAGEGGQ